VSTLNRRLLTVASALNAFFHAVIACFIGISLPRLSGPFSLTESTKALWRWATLTFFINGKNPGEILHHYRRITGFPAMPPLWAFGARMSRCTYVSDAQVLAITDCLRREDYPKDVINLDTGWFAKNWKCDWTFCKERFPDPGVFFKTHAAKGLDRYSGQFSRPINRCQQRHPVNHAR
jgi:hypothetical protein